MTLPGGQKVYKMKRNAGCDEANHEDENTYKKNKKTKVTQFPQMRLLFFSAEFVLNNRTHKAGKKKQTTQSQQLQLRKGQVRT